jgi:hypothetical protein
MRILVIVIEDLAPDRLLKDERLANLRQFMSAGCYGHLAQSAGASSFQEDIVCGRVAQAGGKVVRADRRREALQQQAVHARSFVADGTWNYLRLALGPHPEGSARGQVREAEILALDEAIGQVLELLDNQTIVLLLAGLPADAPRTGETEPTRGAFVLAAPGYPALGELYDVAWLDLAPTVLDAAGYDLPTSLPGRSLVAGIERSSDARDLSMEEEALLRARLEGLGYIG